MHLNIGDALDFGQALSQRIEVEQATRAVRSCRFDRQVHFAVLSHVNVLNDVKFGIGAGIVRVVPRR